MEMDINIITADLAWYFMAAVMMMRPLNDAIKLSFTKTLMKYRKYIGILAGIFSCLHIVAFIMTSESGLSFFSGPVWDFSNLFGWGMLAFLFILPPLLTSSFTAQKILKKNWKRIQYLSYPAYVLAGVHIAFTADNLLFGLLPVVIWFGLLIWSGLAKKL